MSINLIIKLWFVEGCYRSHAQRPALLFKVQDRRDVLRCDGDLVYLVAMRGEPLGCVHLSIAFWTLEVLVLLMCYEVHFVPKGPVAVIAENDLLFDLFLLLAHGTWLLQLCLTQRADCGKIICS